jgi:hypothetical protein
LVEGVPVTLPADLPLGHKIARTAIEKAAKVIKYAAPIGSATYDISVGQHVHVHNVQSDYTPTYHLAESQARYGEAS